MNMLKIVPAQGGGHHKGEPPQRKLAKRETAFYFRGYVFQGFTDRRRQPA